MVEEKTITTAKKWEEKDPTECMVYLNFDAFPVLVWADSWEKNENFYRFIRGGNYITSFPVHQVKKITTECERMFSLKEIEDE